MLLVSRTAGEVAVDGPPFSPSRAAGGRLCLPPKSGVTICRVASPEACEFWFECQGLLGEGSSAVSPAFVSARRSAVGMKIVQQAERID